MYRVTTDGEALEQVAALPDEALASYAEALGVMKLIPWNGLPLNKDNPDGAVRQLIFGHRRDLPNFGSSAPGGRAAGYLGRAVTG